MKIIIDINEFECLINSLICYQMNKRIWIETKEPIYICYGCCGRYQTCKNICEECKNEMAKKSSFIIRHDDLSSLRNNNYNCYDLLTHKYINFDINKIYYFSIINGSGIKNNDEYFIVNI